jgi:predicted PurR-regulated permease PerM
MLDLALLTFVFTFILYVIVDKLQNQFRKISTHRLPALLILALVYMILTAILASVSLNLIPKITQQFTEISNYILIFDFNRFDAALDPRLSALISNVDIARYVADMGVMASQVAVRAGQFSIYLFISLILSFFLILEKEKIKEFGVRLESSKISFIYKYFMGFGGTFARTFGKVMKVQVMISTLNMVICSVTFYIMGFPNIGGIAVMLFFLGLIPVAGTLISLIPLCTIAFAFGGLTKVIQVIIVMIIINALEAYVLNPKLMAYKVRLPVCFVFIILLVGEHYLGVWGLLIGVPIFIFLMTILDVNYETEQKQRRKRVRKRGTV